MIATILFWHLASMVGFILGALLIAHFLRQRRPPSDSLAWMLALILCPYLALPLYLLFGGRKMQAIAKRKRRIEFTDGHETATHLPTLQAVLASHRIPGPHSGHRLTLQTTGPERHAALLSVIAEAQHSLFLSLFILHPDRIGKEVIELLAQRAREGVKVRLLLDGVGSLHTRYRHLAELTEAGGHVAYFMPVFRRPLRTRTNLRNHRKAVIADEAVVWAGGSNIAQEYLGSEEDHGTWRDLTFVLHGPAVRQYCTLFRYDWEFATGEHIHLHAPEHTASGGGIVQVVPSGPDMPGDPLDDALLILAQSARRRLWIVTPYFVPDDAFCRTLALTAHRGVDVRIHLPARSNHWLADLSGRTYLKEVQGAGGKLLFDPRMVHAKAVLVDDEAAVLGSANVDMRSLLLDYEVALFAYDAPTIRAVEHWMEGLHRHARAQVLKQGGWAELAESLARLVAPQL